MTTRATRIGSLVLARRAGEAVRIGEGRLTVAEVRPNRVQLDIEAPCRVNLRPGESVGIGDSLVQVDTHGTQAKLRITAPRDVVVNREETEPDR